MGGNSRFSALNQSLIGEFWKFIEDKDKEIVSLKSSVSLLNLFSFNINIRPTLLVCIEYLYYLQTENLKFFVHCPLPIMFIPRSILCKHKVIVLLKYSYKPRNGVVRGERLPIHFTVVVKNKKRIATKFCIYFSVKVNVFTSFLILGMRFKILRCFVDYYTF